MHALAKFRQYLVGSKFSVRTDHNSLKHFLGQRDLNERQQKWVSKLQSYDFDITFIKGKQNVVADALSRRPQLNALAQITEDWRHRIIAEYAKNPWASSIVDKTEQDDRYTVVDDLIIYKGRILLVPDSEVRTTVLRAFHDLPMAGHPGYYKTYKMVRERFTWKGLKIDVLQYVRECSDCQ